MKKEELVDKLVSLGVPYPARAELMRKTKKELEEMLGYYVEEIFLEEKREGPWMSSGLRTWSPVRASNVLPYLYPAYGSRDSS